MRTIILIFLCLMSFGNTKGQDTKDVIGTKYSYTNSGSDYDFYLNTGFSRGAGSICPNLKWHLTGTSNDTVFIKAIYDLRGHWPASFCFRDDTIKYANFNSSINYFKITTNYIIEKPSDGTIIDTFWHVYDSTFFIGSASINKHNKAKTLLIYPNPARQSVNLPLSTDKVKVYNVFGQIVLDLNNLSPQHSINVSELNSGLHFVELYDKEKNKVGVGKFYKE